MGMEGEAVVFSVGEVDRTLDRNKEKSKRTRTVQRELIPLDCSRDAIGT